MAQEIRSDAALRETGSWDPAVTHRLYFWAPRSEVAFLQAVFDAYEGIGRIRTERHEGDRSLLLVMCSQSQKQSALDLLRQIEKETHGQIIFV